MSLLNSPKQCLTISIAIYIYAGGWGGATPVHTLLATERSMQRRRTPASIPDSGVGCTLIGTVISAYYAPPLRLTPSVLFAQSVPGPVPDLSLFPTCNLVVVNAMGPHTVTSVSTNSGCRDPSDLDLRR